jgi:hypothetical protein
MRDGTENLFARRMWFARKGRPLCDGTRMSNMILTIGLLLAGVGPTQAEDSFCNAVKGLARGSFEDRLSAVEQLIKGRRKASDRIHPDRYPARSVLPGYAGCRIEFEEWGGDVGIRVYLHA